MRYIIELQALCARELANQSRNMTKHERYNFLKNIPKHLLVYVKCFPTDFIVWCEDEMILNQEIIRYYLNNPTYVIKSFKEDCELGIGRRKIMFRKCCNYYCENEFLDKIIHSNYIIFWNICSKCKEYQIYHHKLMKIHREIENFVFI